MSRHRAALAAALTVAVAFGSAGSAAPTATTSPRASSATTVAVSTTGNDATCVRGNLARPCATLDAAYKRARCGETVSVAAGVYPAQVLTEAAAQSACSANVVIRPAAGATVTVDSLLLGNCTGCWSSNAPDRLTFVGLHAGGVLVWGDAENVVFDGIDGGGFLVQGARNVTVRNSDFGPCQSSPETCSRVFVLDGRHAGEPPTSNILFENNTIHDFTLTQDGDHWECVFATGGTNVTFRNNRFDNCQTYAIALGENAYSEIKNWVIEDNWFGRTCCFGVSDRQSAVKFGEQREVSDVVIRRNTFRRGQGVVQETGPPLRNVRVEGNILRFTGCIDGIRYTGNLFEGGRCATDDRLVVYGYAFDGTRLRVDPRRAAAVRAAFQSMAEGATARATARMLAKARYPAPPGRWTGTSVERMLADDVYLGRRLGRSQQHAPLVSRKRWNVVQKALRAG